VPPLSALSPWSGYTPNNGTEPQELQLAHIMSQLDDTLRSIELEVVGTRRPDGGALAPSLEEAYQKLHRAIAAMEEEKRASGDGDARERQRNRLDLLEKVALLHTRHARQVLNGSVVPMREESSVSPRVGGQAPGAVQMMPGRGINTRTPSPPRVLLGVNGCQQRVILAQPVARSPSPVPARSLQMSHAVSGSAIRGASPVGWQLQTSSMDALHAAPNSSLHATSSLPPQAFIGLTSQNAMAGSSRPMYYVVDQQSHMVQQVPSSVSSVAALPMVGTHQQTYSYVEPIASATCPPGLIPHNRALQSPGMHRAQLVQPDPNNSRRTL